MNFRKILQNLSGVLLIEAVCMLLPLLVAILYQEDVLPLLISALFTAAVGGICLLFRPRSRTLHARDGYLVVGLSWIATCLFGAIPFRLYGQQEFSSFVNCFFESVSGFTTTGASVLSQVEALPHSLLFWRSLTHWMGGMGLLVLLLAVLPANNRYSMHVMRAEVPGPTVGKLAPRTRQTAVWLYGLYTVLTVLEIVLLLLGGMGPFDSTVIALSTAGTGGFTVLSSGLATYGFYARTVVTLFMLLFGVNFNLYFWMANRQFKQIFKSEELRVYWLVVLICTVLITFNTRFLYGSWGEAVSASSFEVASTITSTGFTCSTIDFAGTWPLFSRMILFFLMLIGACAGSTGGGIKVARIIILWKKMRHHCQRMLRPRSVHTLKLDGKPVDEQTSYGVMMFMVAYLTITLFTTLAISLDGFDLETSLTASVACISNIGPGFGLVGPLGTYGLFSSFSKLVLCLTMLLGRLEIFPILLCLMPTMYKKHG